MESTSVSIVNRDKRMGNLLDRFPILYYNALYDIKVLKL